MKIGVVLVTFNRLSELKKTIVLYELQTVKPEYILVVDNHSTDGTAEFLREWEQMPGIVPHKLLRLPENTGGSGGFYAGTQAASQLDADWIWLADDDAYPKENVFEVFAHFQTDNPTLMTETVALCTKNYGDNGIAVGHRCVVRKTVAGTYEIPVSKRQYHRPFFDVDLYSFVGTLVRKDILIKAGMPNKDFFIYADDYDHALRMRKYGRILCVPSAQVYHNDNNNYSREASWRDYYATRNNLLVNKWHYGRWAFYTRKLRRMLTAFRSRNPEKVQIIRAAIEDAQNNVTGMHSVYRPGWQPCRKYPPK